MKLRGTEYIKICSNIFKKNHKMQENTVLNINLFGKILQNPKNEDMSITETKN